MKQLIKFGPLLAMLLALTASLLFGCNSSGAQAQEHPETETPYAGKCTCEYFTTEFNRNGEQHTFALADVNHVENDRFAYVYLNAGGEGKDDLCKLQATSRDVKALQDCLHARYQNCQPDSNNIDQMGQGDAAFNLNQWLEQQSQAPRAATNQSCYRTAPCAYVKGTARIAGVIPLNKTARV